MGSEVIVGGEMVQVIELWVWRRDRLWLSYEWVARVSHQACEPHARDEGCVGR